MVVVVGILSVWGFALALIRREHKRNQTFCKRHNCYKVIQYDYQTLEVKQKFYCHKCRNESIVKQFEFELEQWNKGELSLT